MQIVTDSGTDVYLSPEEQEILHIHTIPLSVSLAGKTYQEGRDIQPAEFYTRLAEAESLPTTSQPSIGEFKELYQRLAEKGDAILSIHISSGLSGTVNAARSAAAMVPEAEITVWDTKTLSAAAGWQVVSAAKAALAGWNLERILELLRQIGEASESLYTLKELKYLIHGGRISHMKGLIASLLNIKPIITVDKESGTYVQIGQERSFKRALTGLVEAIGKKFPFGCRLRAQVLHAHNPEGAQMLRELIDSRFECNWLPPGHISLVLGAHTGPSMVGAACGLQDVFEQIP